MLWGLKAFFGYSALINIGLMLFSFVMILGLKDWVYSIHAKLFGISREQFNGAIYHWFAMYKMLNFVFFIVPWFALKIAS